MTRKIDQELVLKIVKEVYRQLGHQFISEHGKTNDERIDYLSIGMMGRLAQCSPKNEAEELILSRLIRKQEVTVKVSCIEFLQLTTKPPILLAQQLAEQLRKLQTFGLIVIEDQPSKYRLKTKKTIYTLEKLKALKPLQGEVFIADNQDVFTPLAKDYLKRKNIRLEIKRGSK